ncbi:hypothetical protein CCMA1212_000386 [Trichoderma ghanense]|uniref:Uncharacterized protein n=1 Tax=Trichoderma ghanense TaxID=65468 RepID=A0ABY2HFC1_9HYPO
MKEATVDESQAQCRVAVRTARRCYCPPRKTDTLRSTGLEAGRDTPRALGLEAADVRIGSPTAQRFRQLRLFRKREKRDQTERGMRLDPGLLGERMSCCCAQSVVMDDVQDET